MVQNELIFCRENSNETFFNHCDHAEERKIAFALIGRRSFLILLCCRKTPILYSQKTTSMQQCATHLFMLYNTLSTYRKDKLCVCMSVRNRWSSDHQSLRLKNFLDRRIFKFFVNFLASEASNRRRPFSKGHRRLPRCENTLEVMIK